MRRFLYLSLVTLATCAIMLVAALVAQASSALKLGWMIPHQVSPSGAAVSLGPHMVVDDSAYIHLIWMEQSLGQADPYYVRSQDHGNTWWNVERIDTPSASHDGSFAVDITGTIHACWWDGEPPAASYELLYAQRTWSGWSLDEPSVVVTDSWVTGPSVAVAGDNIHVIWSNWLQPAPDIYYSRMPLGGDEWLTATVIADTGPASQYARMAVDKNGNLHVVWQENTLPNNHVLYVSGTVGISQTTWSSTITVSTGLTEYATSPDIFVGADDMVNTVFGVDVAGQTYTQDVYYARFPISDTENISPTVIPGSTVAVSQQLPTYASPSIAADSPDNVHVVWNGMRGTDNSDRIYYAMSEDHGASWSQPMAVSPPGDDWADGFATIGTDGTLVHVAWQEKGVGESIYYVHSLRFITYHSLALKDYS